MSELVVPSRRFAALRYHDFRLVWLGELLSSIGSQMQIVAVDWHIFQLVRGQIVSVPLFGSVVNLDAGALALGMLGLVRVLPIIVFALLGGILADTRDRRRLMIWTRATAAVFAGVLAVLTLSGEATPLVIYLLTAAGAAATAFDNPARQSLVPNLVDRKDLANAVSLNTLMFQLATIGGPALAGALIGISGGSATPVVDSAQANAHIGIVYAINAVSFLLAIVALLLMKYRGKAATNTNVSSESLLEGLRFTFRSRIIWGTMLLDFMATFFASARTMLPIVAANILHIGSEGYGLLVTAQPVGALIAGLIVSLRKEIQRQGKVLLISVAVYGLATALFGLSTIFAVSYFLFALTGAGDTVSTVIRGTIRQLHTPDYLRGRMTSVNMIFFMGGPQLGELEAGLVAAAFGAPFAIVSGGIATIVLTALIAWKYPRLRNYTSADAAVDS
jgi:MFS family permease